MKRTWVLTMIVTMASGLFGVLPRSTQAQRYDYVYGYGGQYALRCASENFRDRYCAADTRGGVQLVHRISRAPCRFGDSWGYDRRGIWVTDGCAAEFVVGRGWVRSR